MGKYFYKKANQKARVPEALNGVTDTLANTISLLNPAPKLGKKPPKTTASMGKIPGTKTLKVPSAKEQVPMPKTASKKLNPVSESYKYFRFIKKQTHDQSKINAAKARESGVYPDWVMNKMKKSLEESKKPEGPKQLSLFAKKASLKGKFFSHTTSKSSLSKILDSGKILTGKSLGESRKGLRNIDDMVPDELGEYVSTGRNTIYSGGKRFRAIVMDSPKNKASNLRKETLFKGNISLNPKNVKVFVPSNTISSYKKQYPKYRFFASESVNPKSITAYKPSQNWGDELEDLNRLFKTSQERPKVIQTQTLTKGRVKPYSKVTIEVNTPKGKRLYSAGSKGANSQISLNSAYTKAWNKSIHSVSDSTSYKNFR